MPVTLAGAVITGARSTSEMAMTVEADPTIPAASTAVNVTVNAPAAVIGTFHENVPSLFVAFTVNVGPGEGKLPANVSEAIAPEAEAAVTEKVTVHPGRLCTVAGAVTTGG
jgi:hypothetical protein